jgi:NADH-quinone oxidoreductase subunit C
MSAQELTEHLARDVVGALAPARPKARQDGDGSAPTAEAGRQPKGKRVEEGPPDLLATDDAVVLAERLPDVALYIRDNLGYELLSNITAVDYLADGVIELVYQFMHLEGGPPLVVKVRVPREQPVVPSITPFWPGADLQEREAYDLYGVLFPGHPNLKRVYMWDEFEGHPMRKDFPKQGDKYLASEDEV